MPSLFDLFDGVLLDVDGTLVDSNYQHVLAWVRAFGRFGLTVPAWRVHKALGMGGDRLVTEVTGPTVERDIGDALRDAWGDEYEPLLPQVPALAGAHDMLAGLHALSVPVALTSSGSPEHVRHHLKSLDAEGLVAASTNSEDVAVTKPAADLLEVAMHRLEVRNPLVIGDSTWDAIAAGRSGLVTYAVLTGGFDEAELRAAGAAEVFASLPDLAVALGLPPTRAHFDLVSGARPRSSAHWSEVSPGPR